MSTLKRNTNRADRRFFHAHALAMGLGVAATLLLPPSLGAFPSSSEESEERREALIERTLILAQAPETDRPEKEERAAPREPGAPARSLTPDEIVQAIKLRAQRELAKRRARKWSLSNMLTWTVGNESNPGLLKGHISALYTEEYLSTTFGYKFTPQLNWQLGYSLDALNYDEYTDGSTKTNSLTTKLIWRMVKPLRAEVHYTFDDSEYPYDDGASTWDQKVHLRLRHSFWKTFYHYAGWTYLNKQYKGKLKRESTSTRIAGKRRHDQRHTGIYEIGATFADVNTLKLKQELYYNDSNEGHQDYNDAQDYKVKATFMRDWTPKWTSTNSFTYELKRYERRNVSERGVAQQDYTKTYESGFTYKLSPQVDLAYTWKYKQNDSNDPGQAYQDITNSLALTASF